MTWEELADKGIDYLLWEQLAKEAANASHRPSGETR